MPDLQSSLLNRRRADQDVQRDKCVNPDGIYSGMTKRLACTDGKFVDVQKMPKGKRNRL